MWRARRAGRCDQAWRLPAPQRVRPTHWIPVVQRTDVGEPQPRASVRRGAGLWPWPWAVARVHFNLPHVGSVASELYDGIEGRLRPSGSCS